MKIVKILGGLGNQMFQFAFFLSVSRKSNDSQIDISSFSYYSLHQGFELQEVFNLDLDDRLAPLGDLKKLKDNGKYFKFRKILGKVLFRDTKRFVKSTHFVQPNYSKYDNTVFRKENVYFDGYWQSEKYFQSIKEEITNTFKWEAISGKNLETSRKMRQENSVAIHVRRFDKPKNLKEFFFRFKLLFLWRVCSQKYYVDAVNYMLKEIKEPKFYIFADNIAWVKEKLSVPDDHIIVDWNRNNKSHWDMFLMTQCKHNIIAMSSFSWWGAYLNSNPQKIVVAPKKWALRFSKDIDLIPDTWIRL